MKCVARAPRRALAWGRRVLLAFLASAVLGTVAPTPNAFAQATTPPTTPPAAASAPPTAPSAAPPAALPPATSAAPTNPFLPPLATLHYAPDRDYDLRHLAVTIVVDYPHQTLDGVATNTLSPLRPEGLTQLRFYCGEALDVEGVTVDNVPATYRRESDRLIVDAPHRIAQNVEAQVTIRYRSVRQQGTSFGSGAGGVHWLTPDTAHPDRIGFWTQGETRGNRLWIPTWDYPNDFATMETTTTVPAAWTVIGNGVKVEDREDKKAGTRTVHWKLDQPAATYLLSLAAGPFAVKEDTWQGVPLLYVVPESKRALIEPSFGYTPDMLEFYSQKTGVKYAWPKYAQDAMYEFSGGMENVTATTVEADELIDARADDMDAVSLNSHELAHQWFGDLVTCADWGQIWLNESFATFMQMLYFEHRYGRNAYDREVAHNTRDYLEEARQRYKRPLVTDLYRDPDELFDGHAYPKGGVILHMLRRQIGDAVLFEGLHRYLTTHYDSPVTTSDLRESIADATGFNVQAFFDQWLYKPGHPVLDWSWSYDDAARQVTVVVRQTQDTTDGTPIYDLPLTVGIIAPGGALTRQTFEAKDAQTTFSFADSARPDAVLLDPDHDLLRDIPKQPWTTDALPAIVRFAPDGVDRTQALQQMLGGVPTDDAVAVAAAAVAGDTSADPAFETIQPLVVLKRASLRPLFRGLLVDANADRRAEAIDGLGGLPKDDGDMQALRRIAADPKTPYVVEAAAVRTLGTWDAKGNVDVVQSAVALPSATVRRAAFGALLAGAPQKNIPFVVGAARSTRDAGLRLAALRALGRYPKPDDRIRAALRAALSDPDPFIVAAAASAIGTRKDKTLLPDLQQVRAHPPKDAPEWFDEAVGENIQKLQGGKITLTESE